MKRLLGIVLSIAMVLTSFNVSAGYSVSASGLMPEIKSGTGEDASISDSVSINAAYRTKAEIKEYLNKSGAKLYDSVTYATEPNISAPYGAGVLSETTLESATAMINQIRFIAGLSYDVAENDEYSRMSQAAALVNYLNDSMSHTPSKPSGMSDELYNLAYTGAQKSNIAWAYGEGYTLNAAIVELWMADEDEYNIPMLGHRRWILNPAMGMVGFGSVEGENGTYSAMYAHDSSGKENVSGVAWPARNMPVDYFDISYPWSVSMGTTVNISDIQVTITRAADGKTWNFAKNESDGYFTVNNDNYGQKGCIIFKPDISDMREYKAGDVFNVEITQNGETYVNYSVNFFDPSENDINEESSAESSETDSSESSSGSSEESSVESSAENSTESSSGSSEESSVESSAENSTESSSGSSEESSVESSAESSTESSSESLSESESAAESSEESSSESMSESESASESSEESKEEFIDLNSAGGAVSKIKAKTYDGNPYVPTVKVTVQDGKKKVTLTEGMDYTLSYEDNVNAGMGRVIVKGNGIYKGEISKEFTINKKSVKKLKVETGTMTVGDKNIPPVYVYDGSRLLSINEDYTLSYDDALTQKPTKVAKILITAADNSNYTGSVTAKIAVYDTDASKIINPDNVELSASKAVYTGKAIKDIEPTVTVNGETLVKNKQYKVQYKNNKDTGTAFVIVTGKGEYKGKVVKQFEITPLKTDLTIQPIKAKTYNGKLQKPAVTVKAEKKKLKLNKDYTIIYQGNLHAGKTEVIITGKGNYAGSSARAEFDINPQKISKASVKGTKASGITLTYNKRLLKEGTDYTLVYGSELNNKVIVTITGMGDFTGEVTKNIKLSESAPKSSAVSSTNKNKQNYSTWATTVKSYLTENEDGTLTRVECVNNKVYAENYNQDYTFIDKKQIDMELPVFGGFYAGENYYFLIFGQNNSKEDDKKEIIRVVKYDRQWNRLGAAGLYGANTTVPFDAGSLRAAEYGGMLYVRTCHEMYKSSDGYNHQSNLTFSVRISDMTVTDELSKVWNIGGGYVSHSFNQFIITDGSTLLAADHGDAYPRSVVLLKYNKAAGNETFTGGCNYVEVLPIEGSVGANATGVSVGGFEASSSSYLVAGNSVSQDSNSYNPSNVRNIFVTSTSKDNFTSEGTEVHWITNYRNGASNNVSTPHMVKLTNDEFMLMWTEGNLLKCVILDDTGNQMTGIYSTAGSLSDCKPRQVGDNVVWYYTNNSKPVFNSLNIESVRNSAH